MLDGLTVRDKFCVQKYVTTKLYAPLLVVLGWVGLGPIFSICSGLGWIGSVSQWVALGRVTRNGPRDNSASKLLLSCEVGPKRWFWAPDL